MSGPYGRRRYVEGVAREGERVEPLWGGHVLLRPLASGGMDAASGYPMGGFSPTAPLDEGLDALREAGALSLSMVADPLNAPPPDMVAQAATHRRLKTHYVVDRAAGAALANKHHRYEIRRARRQVTVDRVALSEVMAEWAALYDQLAERHAIDPGARLGPRHFGTLAADPQALVLTARVAGEIAAMSIWLSDGTVAHNHLGASSEAGYAAGASYALYAAAIEELGGCQVLDLGGNPGLADDPSHGLSRFKRGFANGERETWFTGFILDPDGYAAAVTASGVDPSAAYFPAYRAPRSS